MMKIWDWQASNGSVYLFGSRFFTHALFWLAYYLFFSLIWARPDEGYFVSFYLEFVLMPVRILASYCMLYLLIPTYLVRRSYQKFLTGYVVLVLLAGLLQMAFGYLFFANLVQDAQNNFALSIQSWGRASLLVNTTVLLLGCIKVFQLFVALQAQNDAAQTEIGDPAYITVKSERRTHRINIADILYLESMGNYITYYLKHGTKKIVYGSLKEAKLALPNDFVRIHRSYLVNKTQIDSFDSEQIFVDGNAIPRSKEIQDSDLRF